MEKTIAGRIKRAREIRGWKQVELARRVGLSRSNVSRFESGLRTPEVASAIKLAKARDMTLAALILGR